MRLFFQAGFKLILTVLVLAFLTPQQIQAQGSVYLRLAHQAKPVAEKNAGLMKPIASLTKLMLALVVMEKLPDGASWRAPAPFPKTPGSQAGVAGGNTYRRQELLAGLLVASGNDAAEALRLWLKQQGVDAVAAMNQKARTLGLRQPVYGDVMGFGCPRCGSTPAEQWVVLREVWKNPLLRRLLQHRGLLNLRLKNGQTLALRGRLRMVALPASFFGGKTGYTVAAGICLAGVVKTPQGERLGVVMGASSLEQAVGLLSGP